MDNTAMISTKYTNEKKKPNNTCNDDEENCSASEKPQFFICKNCVFHPAFSHKQLACHSLEEETGYRKIRRKVSFEL